MSDNYKGQSRNIERLDKNRVPVLEENFIQRADAFAQTLTSGHRRAARVMRQMQR